MTAPDLEAILREVPLTVQTWCMRDDPECVAIGGCAGGVRPDYPALAARVRAWVEAGIDVERSARAIHAHGTDIPWDVDDEQARALCRRIAAAALADVRRALLGAPPEPGGDASVQKPRSEAGGSDGAALRA